MTAASEEAELVARLKQISDADQAEEDVTAAKQAWYAHAAQFLQRPGVDHWWCQHGDVARGLAEVLRRAHRNPFAACSPCHVSARTGQTACLPAVVTVSINWKCHIVEPTQMVDDHD